MNLEEFEKTLEQRYLKSFMMSGVKKTYIGKVTERKNIVNIFGVYYNGSDIETFITDDKRGYPFICFRNKDEDKVLTKFLRFIELEQYNNIVNVTVNDAAQYERMLMDYLHTNYGYEDKKAKKAIEYFKQQEFILYEFIYYVKNGEYIPEKYETEFRGYTVRRLLKETDLTVLGSFNYMVYLVNKPEEALANLEKGLPRRIIVLDDKAYEEAGE